MKEIYCVDGDWGRLVFLSRLFCIFDTFVVTHSLHKTLRPFIFVCFFQQPAWVWVVVLFVEHVYCNLFDSAIDLMF